MKYNILYMLLALMIVSFASCSKKLESEGLSKVTFFPVVEMSGDEELILASGSSFVEPGITATENGNQIEIKTKVKGIFMGSSNSTIDTNIPDKYVLTYTATNSDGFDANTERTVWVVTTGDLVNSLEGLYTAKVVRTPSQGAVPATNALKYILVWKTGTNTYAISDAIGGYYAIGRNYGETYRSIGLTLTANNIAANDFTVVSNASGVGAFGGSLSTTDVTVNSGAKTIKFTSAWSEGYTFVVTLTQVQL